jgi:Holliday junction DNA helicase RuvB
MEMESPRIIAPQSNSGEDSSDRSLRPAFLDEYVGQTKVKDNLSLFVQAARDRGDASGALALLDTARGRAR